MKAKPTRPYGTIDLISLYAKSKTQTWNDYLTRCWQGRDIRELEKMTARLAAGMDDLVKSKMDSDELRHFYLRLQRSIEKTLKAIWREKHDNPLYDPLNAKEYKGQDKVKDHKKNADNEFEKYYRKIIW